METNDSNTINKILLVLNSESSQGNATFTLQPELDRLHTKATKNGTAMHSKQTWSKLNKNQHRDSPNKLLFFDIFFAVTIYDQSRSEN